MSTDRWGFIMIDAIGFSFSQWKLVWVLVLTFGIAAGCAAPTHYDVILRGGTIYDGSGSSPYVAISRSTATRSPPSVIVWTAPGGRSRSTRPGSLWRQVSST